MLTRRRLLGLSVVAVLAALAAPAGSGTVQRPTRVMHGIGLIRTGSGNWATLSHTNRYSVVIVGSANAASAGRLPGRALIWGCAVNIPKDAWSAQCGVSWQEAVAHRWLLTDTAGQYVPYGDGYSYLLDVGNPAFERRWVKAMLSILKRHHGIDGVFIDNIQGSLFNRSQQYADDASYRRAMLRFIRNAGRALRARGWYVAVNAAINDSGCSNCGGTTWDGSETLWWDRTLTPSVDGIAAEYWQMNWADGSVRTEGAAGTQAWSGWQRIAATVQRLGRDFYALDSGACTDGGAKALYLRASFLLEWRKTRSAFIYACGLGTYDSTADSWQPEWTMDVGRPRRSKVRIGRGWRRDFTAGTVVVNPDPSIAQRFTFARPYVTRDGAAVREVTLAPASAMILRRPRVRSSHTR